MTNRKTQLKITHFLTRIIQGSYELWDTFWDWVDGWPNQSNPKQSNKPNKSKKLIC